MLTWSAKRRLLYLAIVAATLGLIGLAIVATSQPVPTCSDGKQNQDEVGVDCGGVCAQVCPKEIEPIKTLWTRIFAVAPGKYDVAAYVENPNQNHAAVSLKYIVKVWDKENLLINTRRGEAYLNPGEQFILFEPRVDVGERVPDRALFELVEAPVWQKVDKDKPQLSLRRKGYTTDPTPRFTAEVINQSLSSIEDIQVVAVLSGSDENAIAISSTVIDRLDKDAAQEIVFTWPEPLVGTPVFFDLYPHFDLRKLP